MMEKFKILVADAISEKGVAALAAEEQFEVEVKTGMDEESLLSAIQGVSALLVRSQTQVTETVLEAADALKVVGRAGVGVDNVDLDAATRYGVVVMNTPGGNTVSTAEHAFSLMVSLARQIPQAHASVKAGRWDRKKFEGVELHGKTLGVLGMGRIGGEFARRAQAFGMKVLAFDPYLSMARAKAMNVELIEELEELLPRADFLTLHMPLTDETHHMLDAKRLTMVRPGVRIVNCARGGLVDEQALAEAISEGRVAGAALDVYETEPPPEKFALRELDQMIFTPHLGASTAEAQEGVGLEIAEAVRALLLEGTVRNAVNMPSVDAKTMARLQPHLEIGATLGRFLAQISPRRRELLTIRYSGRINDLETSPVSRSILRGFLANAGGRDVNEVNAPTLAANLGLKVKETRSNEAGDFSELIELQAEGEGEKVSVAGTFFGSRPRIVMVNGRHVEAKPHGVLLLLENRDRPGMVGHIGSILGRHQVNIASMSLSRFEQGGNALTLLNLDSVPEPELIDEVRSDADIQSAKIIRL